MSSLDEAIKLINEDLVVGGRIASSGDRFTLYVWDGEASTCKLYLGPEDCRALSKAFATLALALDGKP